SVPSSPAASSYSARAWPISFCAIDEKATSSSRYGAIPVHSESRQPRISSSSAAASRTSVLPGSCALTRLLQPRLQRVAVDAPVVALELVHELRHLAHLASRDEPQRPRLVAPAVQLVRVGPGERLVRRLERSGVGEGRAVALLAEHLPDHAASARTACRTQALASRMRRRRSR